MQNKLFLQKKGSLPSTGKSSYVKTLLWCAVGLIFLIIVAPLFTGKEQKQGDQKPPAEKGGTVLKEIPRPLAAFPERASEPEAMPSEAKKDGLPKLTAIPEMKSFPDGDQSSPSPSPPGTTAQSGTAVGSPPVNEQMPAAHEQQHVGQSPLKKDIPAGHAGQAPSEGTPTPPSANQALASFGPQASAPPVPTDSKAKDASATATSIKKQMKKNAVTDPSAPQPADAQKPAAKTGNTLFTVQVGSFKEKQNAEELQQNLAKRGYGVVVKSTNHPSLGQLYVVQLQPVNDVRKASTLMAQIKQEARVQPVLLKLNSGD